MWYRQWHPTPVLLPGKVYGQRSLVGCCLWGRRVGHNWSDLAAHKDMGFPGGSVVKNLPVNAGDMNSIPESGRSPGEWNGNPVQYSCMGNPIDRGAWWATVHKESGTTERLNSNSKNVTNKNCELHDSVSTTLQTPTGDPHLWRLMQRSLSL